MERKDKDLTYESQTILGILYRKICCIIKGDELSNNSTNDDYLLEKTFLKYISDGNMY